MIDYIRLFLCYFFSYSIFITSFIILLPVYFLNKEFARRLFMVETNYLIVLFLRIAGLNIQFDSLPDNKPYLIISNHMHILDTFLLALASPNTLVFVAKKVLQMIPYFEGLIFINRNGMDLTFFKEAKRSVERGFSVCIFPEGTRVRKGTEKPYQKGVALLARNLDIPIALFCVNTGEVIQENGFLSKIDFSQTVRCKLIEINTYEQIVFKILFDQEDKLKKLVDCDYKFCVHLLDLLSHSIPESGLFQSLHRHLNDLMQIFAINDHIVTEEIITTIIKKHIPIQFPISEILNTMRRGAWVLCKMGDMLKTEKDQLFLEYIEHKIQRNVSTTQ